MKVSNSLIAAAVLVTLPLAAFAVDKERTVTPVTEASSPQFDQLDMNRDGRISPVEASKDSNLVFSAADKNGDGFLDNNEYATRDTSKESMPNKPKY
jgi:hypothetical protein